jgi:hypothetical protein
MGGSAKPVVGVRVGNSLYAEHVEELSLHVTAKDIGSAAVGGASPAAIVLSVDEGDEETFKTLRQVRLDHPTSPVIVLAPGLSTNLAVELLKLGIADCMCLPAPVGTLWRKVERTMLRSGVPTLDSPLLALLWDHKAYPAHEEKRRCFRSETVAEFPAYVTVVTPTMLPKMLVKNLSILTEGCPGGFALVGSNVHLHALDKNPTFRFVLAVPEFGRPIPGQGWVKRILTRPTTSDPTSIIGNEYRLDDPTHEVPVRRFWSESQRRVAAVIRSNAGAIE